MERFHVVHALGLGWPKNLQYIKDEILLRANCAQCVNCCI